MVIEEAFRSLRKSWFNCKLLSKAHERDWEPEDKSNIREENNKELRKIFDEQTEDIINGIPRIINPCCANDLYKGTKW